MRSERSGNTSEREDDGLLAATQQWNVSERAPPPLWMWQGHHGPSGRGRGCSGAGAEVAMGLLRTWSQARGAGSDGRPRSHELEETGNATATQHRPVLPAPPLMASTTMKAVRTVPHEED